MSDTSAPRKAHGHAATRQRLIDVAREIMREDGVAALNLHEVARRAGMKTPSLYTYFSSKHALYDEVFRLGMQAYRAELDSLIRDVGLGPQALEAVIRHYLRFADTNPELYSLLFERPVPGFEPSEASMVEAQGLLSDANQHVEAMLDSGVIVSGLTLEQTRDLVLVVMHGIASLKRANEPDVGIGEGRFGAVLPHAVRLLQSAWFPRQPSGPEGAPS